MPAQSLFRGANRFSMGGCNIQSTGRDRVTYINNINVYYDTNTLGPIPGRQELVGARAEAFRTQKATGGTEELEGSNRKDKRSSHGANTGREANSMGNWSKKMLGLMVVIAIVWLFRNGKDTAVMRLLHLCVRSIFATDKSTDRISHFTAILERVQRVRGNCRV
ncbi:hypothetical protein VKT23_015148 [Stygiomarasmius scandens]|uniref:Uncharacterized protein n=1 Tax=Marasmiellus scandens TaxID=2682957 RepID=A0ABR1J179_9AGAR